MNPEGRLGFNADACVIGAGPSGPATAKALVERGIDNDSIGDRLPTAITDRLMRTGA